MLFPAFRRFFFNFPWLQNDIFRFPAIFSVFFLVFRDFFSAYPAFRQKYTRSSIIDCIAGRYRGGVTGPVKMGYWSFETRILGYWSFETGIFGIPEPSLTHLSQLYDIDLIVHSLLAGYTKIGAYTMMHTQYMLMGIAVFITLIFEMNLDLRCHWRILPFA